MSGDGTTALETIEAPSRPGHLAIDVRGRTRVLAVGRVQEIMRVASITRVPQAPAHVRGLTTLRGRLLPVIDVGAAGDGAQARVVVVALERRLIGVLVDRVLGVVVAPADAQVLDVDLFAGSES